MEKNNSQKICFKFKESIINHAHSCSADVEGNLIFYLFFYFRTKTKLNNQFVDFAFLFLPEIFQYPCRMDVSSKILIDLVRDLDSTEGYKLFSLIIWFPYLVFSAIFVVCKFHGQYVAASLIQPSLPFLILMIICCIVDVPSTRITMIYLYISFPIAIHCILVLNRIVIHIHLLIQ